MGSEIKSAGVKVETTASRSLAKKFKSHCKKLNVAMAQRLRDLMQQDIKQ